MKKEEILKMKGESVFDSDKNIKVIVESIFEVKKSIDKLQIKIIGISEGLYRLKRSLRTNNVVLRDLTKVLRRLLEPRNNEEVIEEFEKLRKAKII